MRAYIRELRSSRVRIGVAVALASGLIALVLSIRDAYTLAVVWSALMLASFVGWGSLVNLWLARDRWVDWGLRAGWGMGVSILTGGFLTLAHIAVRPVLVVQVALGVAALLAVWAVRGRTGSLLRWRRLGATALGHAGVVAILVGGYGIAAFIGAAYLGDHRFNPSDDPPLYFTLAEKLVQTSSLLEPFAARRISTFGAQAYLHGSFISVASIYYSFFIGDGLALVLVLALVVGLVKRSGFKTWHAVPLALVITLLFSLRPVRVNTASLLSSVVAVLTLYRTIRSPAEPHEQPIWPIGTRRVIALAALTVVPIVLRTSNTAAILPFMVLVFSSDYLLASRKPWSGASLKSLLVVSAMFVGVFVVTMLPWSIMLKQSCGTFFYPLGQSNLTPGWTFLKPSTTKATLATGLLAHLFHDAPVGALLPFMAAGLIPLSGRARNDLVALTVASFIGIYALADTATAFDPNDSARYYYAYVVSMALVAAASVERVGGRAGVVGAALAVHLVVGRDERKYFTDLVNMAHQGYVDTDVERLPFGAATGDYRDIQGHIPVNATIATAVHENYRFDFARNKIFSLDVLGGMGPKPGWPSFRGAAVLADYLLATGVRYLVFVDFNEPSEFYNRAHWRGLAVSRAETYLASEAALQLDAEDAIEGVAGIRHVVYRAHGMTVVDLGAAP